MVLLLLLSLITLMLLLRFTLLSLLLRPTLLSPLLLTLSHTRRTRHLLAGRVTYSLDTPLVH